MILRRHGAFYASCLAAFTAGHIVNYAVILLSLIHISEPTRPY